MSPTSHYVANPEDLRGHAGQLEVYATSAQGGFSALRADLDALEGAFQGAAARRFAELMEDWQGSAADVTAALAALAQILRDEADAVEALDADLAAGA